MKEKRTLSVIAFVLLTVLAAATAAEERTEAIVRVAYLFNFAKFAKWPPESFTSPSEPFKICAVGETSLKGALEKLEEKEVEGRKIKVSFFPSPKSEGASHCQIAYFEKDLGDVSFLHSSGVLTVAENDVNSILIFVAIENTLRFKVNQKQLSNLKVSLSAQLLKLALSE